MAFAHETLSQYHGFEHVIIYGIVIFSITVAIKLLWKV